ncbi:hypothetical protein BD311DRAFT_787117 [Dichomitus squalens]|uniref:Uncharacterized protein n=1 Tax=Dichomitus squalens TaxID=114155 RepID=A0A4Q9MTI4_9APHY|nr:hypothetical protein BD311DRAFT_787117 [Dichomitus squalens]
MSNILERQNDENQFERDTVTGRYIQKQSIPKWLVKAVGANATVLIWGKRGMFGKLCYKTPQNLVDNARKRRQRALLKSQAHKVKSRPPPPVVSKAKRSAGKKRPNSLPTPEVFTRSSLAARAIAGLQTSGEHHHASPTECHAWGATAPPTRGRRPEQMPYSRDSALIYRHEPAYYPHATSSRYTTPQGPFAGHPPFRPIPSAAPREAYTPLPNRPTQAGFAGTDYAGCVFAQAAAGRLVPPPQVALPNAFVAQAGEPLVNWYGASTVCPYSALSYSTRERYTGVAVSSPLGPSTLALEQVSNLDDELFDLKALEDSMASSSLSDALVDHHAAPVYTGHVRTDDALPGSYTGAVSIGVSGWTGSPEATVYYVNPGAHSTIGVEPTLNAMYAASIVGATVDTFPGIPSIVPLTSQMEIDPTFSGCFDECEPLWLPSSTSNNSFGVHDTVEQWFDGTYLASSPSSHYPQPELAFPFTGAGSWLQ